MSEPEIARRCSSCGASIRVRAFFCPQCGKTLSPKTGPTEAVQDEEPEMPGLTKAELVADTLEISASKQLESEHERGIPTVTSDPNPTVQRKPPVQATLGTAHRAGAAPRKIVEDDGAHKVEKWRQLSSAVLDEAAYDPSLRFVLVAAVLFVLFVVILILSELIT